jgi:serine/threonine protein kinase
MGEVYRARDVRLGRDVAVKVLPAACSADAERLARFEQEARATGILNHPNILAIFDIGTYEDAPYVISELLEGSTLRERLAGGPLPHRRTLDYAQQIASGLAAAHAKGIVHRDLKPENLFITRDGHIKILDFGLAKLVAPQKADGHSIHGARTAVQTSAHVMLGTPGYMSPEQIRGHGEDHRSDLFAYGIILFEMMTGKAPFYRDSPADTSAAILNDEPPEITVPGKPVPPGLERIVRHCLEKNPDDRFQSTRDVAFAVGALSGAWDPVSTGGSGVLPKIRSGPSPRISQAQHAVDLRFRQLTFRRGTIHSARFAPDGHTIVYTAAWDGGPPQILTTRSEFPESKPLGFGDSILLSISSASELAISRKPRHLRHRQFSGTLSRVPLAGSAPRALMESVQEADWSPDGRGVAVVRNAGGWPRLEYPAGKTLLETRGWMSHIRVSPRGDLVAFCEHPVQGDNRGSVAVISTNGELKRISTGWDGSVEGIAWSPTGDEIWFSAAEAGAARALHAVTLSGEVRTLLRTAGGITLQDVFSDGRVLITRDVERGGILGMGPGDTVERDLSWLDGSVAIDLSDDGRTLLFMEQGSAVGPTYAVCLRETDGSPVVRLGEGVPHSLSPDGAWVLTVLHDPVSELVLLPTGAGETRTLPCHGIVRYFAARWFPDGERILFVGSEQGAGPRCYVQPLDGGEPTAITAEGVALRGLPLSPDGKTLVAVGADRVPFLQPVVGGDDPRPVPGHASGDILIRWGADGKSIYVFGSSGLPTNVYRLDLETGTRELVRTLMPADPAGVQGIGQIRMTPDASAYVYSFKRLLCELYLVEGLA